MTSKALEREIIRKLRQRLREYFPNLQMLIDTNVITKNDWLFFGILQLNLIKCFLDSPERSIRKSKSQLKQIIKFYEMEIRARKYVIKSNTFTIENDVDQKNIEKQISFYVSHKDYWVNRKDSKELYFNYELLLFLYYKWMKSYEFDVDNTIELIMYVMKLTDFYGYKYFTVEKLKVSRKNLLNQMKVCGLMLVNDNENYPSIIDISMYKNMLDLEVFIKEIQGHL